MQQFIKHHCSPDISKCTSPVINRRQRLLKGHRASEKPTHVHLCRCRYVCCSQRATHRLCSVFLVPAEKNLEDLIQTKRVRAETPNQPVDARCPPQHVFCFCQIVKLHIKLKRTSLRRKWVFVIRGAFQWARKNWCHGHMEPLFEDRQTEALCSKRGERSGARSYLRLIEVVKVWKVKMLFMQNVISVYYYYIIHTSMVTIETMQNPFYVLNDYCHLNESYFLNSKLVK